MIKRLFLICFLALTPLYATPSQTEQYKSALKVLNKWEKRFHCETLRFHLKIASLEEILKITNGQLAFGVSFSSDDPKYDVEIWILDAKDYPKTITNTKTGEQMQVTDEKIKRDQVNTVVHELLHVLLHASPSEEFFVHHIADGIIQESKLKVN